ncbi:LysR family transcriptional regulator [Vibrio pectenicida]|uniref:LysR family transcriptional regulator n=1 Tax=Vibrio pectenicida TaxID=62763 RepID=A0A7Y4EG18_9VIBR|nr:LysR family transcriptional regulator [Vibrio pectenicida]NOH73192.1 LysR family transcriptional regulator [Vibrio pectenicida]
MAKISNQFSDIGNQLNWDDTRVFLAIARTGTLSGASKLLGTGIATTSRRLERLESALSIRLFTRSQLGYRLTDEGADLISQAETLEQAGFAFGVAASVKDNTVSGHVRLATAQGLADDFIIPALPDFIEAYPNLTIEIVTSVTRVNLHKHDADLAIRMVRPDCGNISIRRLGKLGFGLYAAESYLQRKPRYENSGQLENHDFIGWSEHQQHLPAAQWLTRTLRGRPCRLTTTSLSAQVRAVQAGIGLAILPHFIGQQRELVCIQSDVGCDQPIWSAVHTDLLHSRRVRAVTEFLSDLIQTKSQALAGDDTVVNQCFSYITVPDSDDHIDTLSCC